MKSLWQGDRHSGWGRGHCQKRIDHTRRACGSREYKARENATEERDIGDGFGHDNTPNTSNNNRVPLANSRPYWLLTPRRRHLPLFRCPETAAPFDRSAFYPRSSILATLVARGHGVPENVFHQRLRAYASCCNSELASQHAVALQHRFILVMQGQRC